MAKPLRIRDLEIYALDVGRFSLDGGAMFGMVPKPLWSKRIVPDAYNRIELGLRTLLVKGPKFTCLIDTGMGTKWSNKEQEMFQLKTQDIGAVVEAETGVKPNEVTHVLLTHLHFDHAGGATWVNPETQVLEARFAKASYFLQESNLKWAKECGPRERASYRADNYEPLVKSGQLQLVRTQLGAQTEVLSGLLVERTEGHTRGQQIVHIPSRAKHVVYCADLLPTRHHVGAVWGMGYDIEPLKVIQEKKQLLQRATKEDWMLVLEHDPDEIYVQVENDEKKSLGQDLEFKTRPKGLGFDEF